MTLTLHQLREVLARIAWGESPAKLAEEYGVVPTSLEMSLAPQ